MWLPCIYWLSNESLIFFPSFSLYLEFPTNKTELNAVFDIFDQSHTGKIDYRNFTDAMKPDRHVSN